jgi:plastocyanin
MLPRFPKPIRTVPRWGLAVLLCMLALSVGAQQEPLMLPQPDPRAVEVEPATAVIRGQLRLFEEDGTPVTDRRELANAVVYFEPDEPPELHPPEQPLVMTTQRREFVPRVLPVVAGTTVRFPNEDPILHNVFSTSPGNRFDLGVYGESPGKSHRFDHPGLVRVFCNVHSAMSAHIVVVNSPHFTVPDRDGRFSLEGLPPGPGRLTFWHERAEPDRMLVELDAGDDLEHDRQLELTVRQAAPTRERFRRRGRY